MTKVTPFQEGTFVVREQVEFKFMEHLCEIAVGGEPCMRFVARKLLRDQLSGAVSAALRHEDANVRIIVAQFLGSSKYAQSNSMKAWAIDELRRLKADDSTSQHAYGGFQ